MRGRTTPPREPLRDDVPDADSGRLQPTAAESLRETQPLRPAEAGEAVGHPQESLRQESHRQESARQESRQQESRPRESLRDESLRQENLRGDGPRQQEIRSREIRSQDDSLPAARPAPVTSAAHAAGPSRGDAAVTPGQITASHFLSERDSDLFRQRWMHLQSGFIDQPRETVEEADRLLGDVLERFTRGLNAERDSLAARWRSGGDDTDTEELRLAVQGYRSYLERLLGS